MRAGARAGALVLLLAVAPLARGADEPLRALVDRLTAADASARAEAACELGRRGHAATPALRALAALLPDGTAVGPVECGMSPWLRKQLEARPEDWHRFETSAGREAALALARIGRPALATLVDALAAPSAQARAHAALGVAEMEAKEGRAEALGRLMQAAKDEDAGVREAVVSALGEIESAEAVPVLLGALRDGEASVRAAAAWALGQIEDRRAVEPLVRSLWDAEASVRRQAAWALGQLEDARAVPLLTRTLADADVEVRTQSAWALGQIADPSAAGSLAKALKDASPAVRKQAAWALGELKGLKEQE
jgi:hypothetical protein